MDPSTTATTTTTTTTASASISTSQAIQLIHAFLNENSLSKTAKMLVSETRTDGIVGCSSHASSSSMIVVASASDFHKLILNGHWDKVLETIPPPLPHSSSSAASVSSTRKIKLMDLYEQIVIELCEMREVSAARSLLRQTIVLASWLKNSDIDRFLALEGLVSRSFFDEREAYARWADNTTGKQQQQQQSFKMMRRMAISNAFQSDIVQVPPGRLLSLLGQALKWQQSLGLLDISSSSASSSTSTGQLAESLEYDLLLGKPISSTTGGGGEGDEETLVENSVESMYNSIKFPRKGHAECGAFSPDGQFFATGTLDGFIEIWNYSTGKLRRDLVYQAQNAPMAMSSAILCLAFSPIAGTVSTSTTTTTTTNNTSTSSTSSSLLLACGTQDGSISVWSVTTGKTVKSFKSAHGQGVTCVAMSGGGGDVFTDQGGAMTVLSGSFDGTIRLHGMKSGKLLKEFRGHSSFVNTVAFANTSSTTSSSAVVVSGSSDGSIKVWDLKSTTCLRTIYLKEGGSVALGSTCPSVYRLIVVPRYKVIQSGIGGGGGDVLVVGNKSGIIYVVDVATGDVLSSMEIPAPMPKKQATTTFSTSSSSSSNQSTGSTSQTLLPPPPDILALCLTSSSKAIYAVCEDGYAYFFNLSETSSMSTTVSSTKISYTLKSSIKIAADISGGSGTGGLDEVIGLAACPTSNVLAVWSESGTVGFWR